MTARRWLLRWALRSAAVGATAVGANTLRKRRRAATVGAAPPPEPWSPLPAEPSTNAADTVATGLSASATAAGAEVLARPEVVPGPADASHHHPTAAVPTAAVPAAAVPSAAVQTAAVPAAMGEAAVPAVEAEVGAVATAAGSGTAPAEVRAAGATGPDTWVAPIDAGCPLSHPVKANADSGIYHVPGGLSYERVVPERCYRTPEDAEADGFRAAKR